jgi:ketosteroid isomerase-like protein
MGRTNLDVLRGFYAAWNDDDVDRLLEAFDPDVELWPLILPLVSTEVYRGHEGVARWFGEVNERFERTCCYPEQIVEIGDQVIVFLRIVARERDGTELDTPIANVLTMREGKIVEFEGRDVEETREELEVEPVEFA